MSLLNPVYACHVTDADRALANLLLPGRPLVGDSITILGRARVVASVSVDWGKIVKGNIYHPDKIPCQVVVE